MKYIYLKQRIIMFAIFSVLLFASCNENGNNKKTKADLSELKVELTVKHISKRGFSDGAIYCSVTGGEKPYVFSWSGGSVTKDITGLKAGTYSVIVTDSKGVQVAEEKTIIEPRQFTDIEGNIYETIIIGNIQWFASNAKMKKTQKNLSIMQGKNILGGSTEPRYYTFKQKGSSTSEKDPVFYNWPAVQAICPEGWRIPTMGDWENLLTYLAEEGQGGNGISAINKLKSSVSSSGFNLLFTGYWDAGSFYTKGNTAVFWSSTQWANDRRDNWVIKISQKSVIEKMPWDKRCAFSVRFVKDME